MEEVRIPLEELARLTGKTAVELKAELFNSNGEESTQKEDAVKIISSAISSKFTSIRDESHKLGVKSAMEKVEGWVREKGDVPADLRGTELLEAWAATLQKSEGGGKGSKLTAEELEQNEIAQTWLNAKVKTMKEAHERKLSGLTEQLTNAQQKALRDRVQREALAVLEGSKWIAGDDEDTRKKRVDAIFRLLEYDHIKEDETGNLIVTDASGMPRKDATFNQVAFSEYVKEANPFGFHKFDPGKSSPSPEPVGGKPGGGQPKILIRDQAHYNELKAQRQQEKDPIKRMNSLSELNKAWIEQRAK